MSTNALVKKGVCGLARLLSKKRLKTGNTIRLRISKEVESNGYG